MSIPVEHKEMKVALIQQVCPAYRAKFFEKLSIIFAQKGFKLTVFFGKPQRGLTYSGIIPDSELNGFQFDYKILPKIAYEGKLPISPFHFKRSLIFFPTLIFEITRGKYDIIISDSVGDLLNVLPLFVINKLLLRKTFIVWCGGNIKDNAPKPHDNLFKKVAYVLARMIYHNVNASIVYGQASKEFDMFMSTPPDRIFVALNTVDTFYFEEVIKAAKNLIESLKRKLGVTRKRTVLYVGVLEKRKKLENLILAFKELKKSMNNTVLLLVGDGPYREHLQNLCIKEKIEDVHFLGKIGYDKVPLFYALSDIFVLPAEGGIAVAEAMVSGKPVIITEECNALRSIPNLVKHGENGFILKEDDIASLAEHMAKILSSSVLARKMGERSKDMAEKYFSIQMMLKGFEQAVDYVVANRSR